MTMQRQTRQRAAIREAIRSADRPLSPAEILQDAKGAVPGLGIATVYRNVKCLIEEGELTEVALPGEPPRYEIAGKAHHHHFRCRRCDKVFDITACPRDLAGLTPKGFRLDAHEIVLYGACPSCVANS